MADRLGLAVKDRSKNRVNKEEISSVNKSNDAPQGGTARSWRGNNVKRFQPCCALSKL